MRRPARGRAVVKRPAPRRPGPLRRYEFAWPYLCAPDEAATNDRAYRSRRQPVFRAAKLVAGRPVHVAQEDDATGPLTGLKTVIAASQVGCPLLWSHSSRSSARLASIS